MALAALVFILFLHGAVPFVAMPTLGQAVWLTGFSQSFVNDSLLSIHATNMGAPHEAAIAFGLAGALPAAAFIAAGLHPGDAYSATVALWLSVAFFGCYGLCRSFSVSPRLAVLGGLFWLSLPVVWGHADYSMLSTGIALLPLYLLAARRLFAMQQTRTFEATREAGVYAAICIGAVFMDGYTFMMFATGSTILAFWVLVVSPKERWPMLSVRLPIHVASFGAAYLLYAVYVGSSGFGAAPLEFFRAWGIDLSYLVQPSQGVHWLPDVIGYSVSRSEADHFGDASVWRTSFLLPLFLGAVWAVRLVERRWSQLGGIVLLAVVGFYMSLGPSLKVNSTKPEDAQVGPLMPAEYAIAPTGSGPISNYVPGFRSMRASYRWIALASLGAWMLCIVPLGARDRQIRRTAVVTIVAIMALSLPHLQKDWTNDRRHRESLLELDRTVVADLRLSIPEHATVVFLPWRNDFLVNYVAARLNFVAFNIGGDKNYMQARRHWPPTISEFPMGRIDENFAPRVAEVLARGEADIVVLPYIDMLWAAHRWPDANNYERDVSEIVAELREHDGLRIVERKYHAAVVMARDPWNNAEVQRRLLESLCLPPLSLRRSGCSPEGSGGAWSMSFQERGSRRHARSSRKRAAGCWSRAMSSSQGRWRPSRRAVGITSFELIQRASVWCMDEGY